MLFSTNTLISQSLNDSHSPARTSAHIYSNFPNSRVFETSEFQMMPLVEKTARMIGEYSYCRPWGGGVFTDSKNFYGCTTRLPDLIIFLNTKNYVNFDHVAVRDAAKMLIPTVGIVDSNCDPRLISYPVPGNDDSPVTIRYWCGLFAEAIARAKRRARRDESLRKMTGAVDGAQAHV